MEPPVREYHSHFTDCFLEKSCIYNLGTDNYFSMLKQKNDKERGTILNSYLREILFSIKISKG